MKIFTIGFTKKSAEEFFYLLRTNKIERLVDIRLRPNGQLSGFAKQEDLPYFLVNLANECEYMHLPELAPTSEILEEYRSNKDWDYYEKNFDKLMEDRNIPDSMQRSEFIAKKSCFLCSEASPEFCHRRLVAERFAQAWGDVEIIHL